MSRLRYHDLPELQVDIAIFVIGVSFVNLIILAQTCKIFQNFTFDIPKLVCQVH